MRVRDFERACRGIVKQTAALECELFTVPGDDRKPYRMTTREFNRRRALLIKHLARYHQLLGDNE